jgi:hypothetical protein
MPYFTVFVHNNEAANVMEEIKGKGIEGYFLITVYKPVFLFDLKMLLRGNTLK